MLEQKKEFIFDYAMEHLYRKINVLNKDWCLKKKKIRIYAHPQKLYKSQLYSDLIMVKLFELLGGFLTEKRTSDSSFHKSLDFQQSLSDFPAILLVM